MTDLLTSADAFRPTPPEHPSRRHEWERGVGLAAGEEDFEDEKQERETDE